MMCGTSSIMQGPTNRHRQGSVSSCRPTPPRGGIPRCQPLRVRPQAHGFLKTMKAPSSIRARPLQFLEVSQDPAALRRVRRWANRHWFRVVRPRVPPAYPHWLHSRRHGRPRSHRLFPLILHMRRKAQSKNYKRGAAHSRMRSTRRTVTKARSAQYHERIQMG